MFARQCSTYIFCARWENQSALDGFFVASQQLTRETSSLTSCIFPVGITFRNPLWLNIVLGDAIVVVCPYAYMAKFAITRLVVMDTRMCNKKIFLERTFRCFLLTEFTRQKFFLRLMRHVTDLRNVVESLFLWGCGRICWWQWSNGDCWCCCWPRWSNEDCLCCCWRPFFILNIFGTFWECLAARFKSFLPIVYTYNAHTTTLMVTAKWFIWSHSNNVWRVRRPLKRKWKEKSCHNLGTTYQEWMSYPYI